MKLINFVMALQIKEKRTILPFFFEFGGENCHHFFLSGFLLADWCAISVQFIQKEEIVDYARELVTFLVICICM